MAREGRFLLIGGLPFGPDMTNTFFQKIWSRPDLTDTYSLKWGLHINGKARLPKRYPFRWPGIFDDLFGNGGFLLIDGLPFGSDLANTFLKNANGKLLKKALRNFCLAPSSDCWWLDPDTKIPLAKTGNQALIWILEICSPSMKSNLTLMSERRLPRLLPSLRCHLMLVEIHLIFSSYFWKLPRFSWSAKMS